MNALAAKNEVKAMIEEMMYQPLSLSLIKGYADAYPNMTQTDRKAARQAIVNVLLKAVTWTRPANIDKPEKRSDAGPTGKTTSTAGQIKSRGLQPFEGGVSNVITDKKTGKESVADTHEAAYNAAIAAPWGSDNKSIVETKYAPKSLKTTQTTQERVSGTGTNTTTSRSLEQKDQYKEYVGEKGRGGYEVANTKSVRPIAEVGNRGHTVNILTHHKNRLGEEGEHTGVKHDVGFMDTDAIKDAHKHLSSDELLEGMGAMYVALQGQHSGRQGDIWAKHEKASKKLGVEQKKAAKNAPVINEEGENVNRGMRKEQAKYEAMHPDNRSEGATARYEGNAAKLKTAADSLKGDHAKQQNTLTENTLREYENHKSNANNLVSHMGAFREMFRDKAPMAGSAMEDEAKHSRAMKFTTGLVNAAKQSSRTETSGHAELTALSQRHVGARSKRTTTPLTPDETKTEVTGNRKAIDSSLGDKISPDSPVLISTNDKSPSIPGKTFGSKRDSKGDLIPTGDIPSGTQHKTDISQSSGTGYAVNRLTEMTGGMRQGKGSRTGLPQFNMYESHSAGATASDLEQSKAERREKKERKIEEPSSSAGGVGDTGDNTRAKTDAAAGLGASTDPEANFKPGATKKPQSGSVDYNTLADTSTLANRPFPGGGEIRQEGETRPPKSGATGFQGPMEEYLTTPGAGIDDDDRTIPKTYTNPPGKSTQGKPLPTQAEQIKSSLKKLSGGVKFEMSQKAFKAILKEVLKKAMTAGHGYAGAPGDMSGGSVMMTESLDKKMCAACATETYHKGEMCLKCALDKEWAPEELAELRKELAKLAMKSFLRENITKSFSDGGMILHVFADSIWTKIEKGISPAHVGHTSSGKRIFMSMCQLDPNDYHTSFKKSDHIDAIKYHMAEASTSNKDNKYIMRDTHVWHAIEHLHKCFYYAKAYGVDKQVFDSFDEWCLEK